MSKLFNFFGTLLLVALTFLWALIVVVFALVIRIAVYGTVIAGTGWVVWKILQSAGVLH